MAQKITMDMELRFIDNATSQAKSASKAFDTIEKEAKEAGKEIDNLAKKKAKPSVDADTSKVDRKLNKIDSLLKKLGFRKTKTTIDADDKATAKLTRALNKAREWSGKKFKAFLELKDSDALRSLEKMSNSLKSITSKTWSALVKIKDSFTAPLNALRNSLFNIRSLIAGIASAWAAIKFIKEPISVADAYSSAKISFSTLLGESQGQQMMDSLDEFAKATPFNTTNVIENAQKMLAMGWEAENIISDMEVIGNAAAATGKLDTGLESIVRALSQIKTKGKLSTEELNQLAEAGIAAKAMLAEQLGYGTGDTGIAAMTKDLEDGAIASDKAIAALLAGMRKYDGMMDSMANETVDGLKSQLADAFNINVVRKWGQGLQDGAKRGFGTVLELLDEAEGALEEIGETVYQVGKTISNWAADKLENAVKRITEITGSYEFQNANLGEKISMLWRGVIVDPLMEWWENGGRDKTIETAGKIGSWMGEMLTKGLLALFGATNVLNEDIGATAGGSIAGAFLDGFLTNFDGQAITDALVDAISNVWGALPGWAKLLIGGYGVGKAAGGLANFAGGVSNFVGGVSNVLGSASSMTGLFGLGANAAIGLGAGNLAGGASLSAAALSALGLAGVAGGVAGGASLIKGGVDLYRGYTTDDEIEAKALKASGKIGVGSTLTGAATGALIGSVVPVIGTALGALIGAGLGGVGGWIAGNKTANNIRADMYESEAAKAAATNESLSEAERELEIAKAKWENAKKYFGEIKLSLSEIERLADQIVWGDDMANYDKFTTSVKAAEASLESMKSSAVTIEKWMWKAGLGVEFNSDEMESIVATFDEYIASAKATIENKHYEFTAAVSLLIGTDSEGGKSIIESGNAYYGGLQEQLNDLGSQLSEAIRTALEDDGVISDVSITLPDGTLQLSEAEEITELQRQIAEITAKVADAEQRSELALIQLKFGKGNLDYESFENFMAQMQTTIDERMQASDKAYTASVANLYLQLDAEAITQDEFDAQLQTLIDGYTANVESLQAQVKDLELNIIGQAYASKLGSDAVSDLSKALEFAIQHDMDPIELSDATLASLLQINLSNNGETVSNIKDMLSGVFNQLEALDIEESITANVNNVEVATGKDFVANITNKVKEKIPDPIQTEVNFEATAKLEALKKMTQDELALEFGLTEPQAATIYWMLKADPTYEEIEVTAAKFGIQNSYLFSPTVTIDPYVTTNSKTFTLQMGEGFRGGIFGTSGVPGFFDGGIVRGGAQLIKVAEEGSPEMVIPLSSQRRQRGLDLWEKAGQMLGVPGFFRGGRTDGRDEGIRFTRYGSGEASGGQTVQIDVGGVKVELHVNSDGSTNIAEAVKAQLGEITDAVVGAIADELGAMFENTPVRGGA